MNKIAQIVWLVFILFSIHTTFSQSSEKYFVIPDSLKNRTSDQVYNSYKSTIKIKDTFRSRVYLKTYLEKARIDKDSIKMARAYGLLYFFERNDTLKIKYLDKSIELSKNQNHQFYPAFSYSSKGNFYLKKWNYEKALDNYLIALGFTKKNKNKDFQYLTQHNIAVIKGKLGKYQEALDIFKECLDYEKKRGVRDTLDYLEIIVDLTEMYTKNSMIDSSDYYLKQGFDISKKLNNNLYHRLLFNQGVNFYYNENYSEAEKNINESLPYLSSLEDKRHIVNAYFYLGKINESMSNENEANYFHVRIDSIFQHTKFITPEVRDSYSFLINYYKEKEDFKSQLIYVERLLKFDSILHQNNILVNEKLIKKYDTAELLAEQEKLIESIHGKNFNFKMFIGFLIVVVIVISALFYYQYEKRKLYSKRFKALVEEKKQEAKNSKNKGLGKLEKKTLKISEDIKEDILKKIERFETNLEFLEPNITTNSLAIQFKTNSKYISRIINTYKEKNFTNYINDLRIEYLIQELKINKKFRNYTIKAISSEIGFNTTEAFSKYFHKKTGLYPSYFIKKMEEYVS